MAVRFLRLEDGSEYKGEAFGFGGEAAGEVVFTTGMVGYHEAITDPSYKGQILVFTYPLIGNYGIPYLDRTKKVLGFFESRTVKVSGLVVSQYIDEYSHHKACQSLDKWLKEEKIPAISGVDTRSLTIKLREKGVMLGCLVNHNKKKRQFEDPNKENLVEKVSIKTPRILGKGKKKILLIDCGVKEGILEELLKRNITVNQVPWDFDPDSESGFSFDGVVISNGPGDPKMVGKTIQIVQKLMNKSIPILGICLGHQILALASGADTYKMKFGHRSCNQPVVLTGSKKCFLTTQNHGFVVDEKKLSSDWEVWFTNLNDKTNEGIRHKKYPFMSVQFHPEGRPGPYDTNFLFDEFLRYLR